MSSSLTIDSARIPLVEVFAAVPDPRARRGVRHALPVVLTVATAAVLAGAKSLLAVSEWVAEVDREALSQLGIGPDVVLPSESTIRRTLAGLDGNDLDARVGAWMVTRVSTVGGRQVIAVDGKSLRGATHQGAMPHLLATLAHDSGVVLGQRAVGEKGSEIPALKDLLAPMDLTGVVVTADALHCQRDTASWLVGRGAHYVLTVKGNQCATRRSDGFPPQAGGTRREVPGSDGLPGAERRRGQQHVRKPTAGPGVLGTARWEDPHGMAKAGLLEPQSPAAAIYCDRNGTCHRCPSRPGRNGSSWSTFAAEAMPSEGIEGDEWGACSRARYVHRRRTWDHRPSPAGGDGVLVVVAGVTPGRGGRESRSQGEGAQVGADDRETWRYA